MNDSSFCSLPMVNKQLPEYPTSHTSDNVLYDIVDIFPTIQGEGPFAGRPSIFIRLAGCNLQCPFCDTDYTTGRRKMETLDILKEVDAIKLTSRGPGFIDLIVITGGEPFRQDIGFLCQRLHNRGNTVQIETNGTVFRDPFPYENVVIVCSPKTPTINNSLRPHIDFFKYVVQSGGTDENGLPMHVLGQTPRGIAMPYRFEGANIPPHEIYISPMDCNDPIKNQRNTEHAAEICMQFGYTLSLQIHKIIGYK